MQEFVTKTNIKILNQNFENVQILLFKRIAFAGCLKISLITKRNTKKRFFLLCVKINSDYLLNLSNNSE